MDDPNVEFTRDVAGALKERAGAQSMMAKHASAQREAMQEACLGALRKALPGASAETCLMALETANWDVDRAHAQVKGRARREEEKKEKKERAERRRRRARRTGGPDRRLHDRRHRAGEFQRRGGAQAGDSGGAGTKGRGVQARDVSAHEERFRRFGESARAGAAEGAEEERVQHGGHGDGGEGEQDTGAGRAGRGEVERSTETLPRASPLALPLVSRQSREKKRVQLASGRQLDEDPPDFPVQQTGSGSANQRSPDSISATVRVSTRAVRTPSAHRRGPASAHQRSPAHGRRTFRR